MAFQVFGWLEIGHICQAELSYDCVSSGRVGEGEIAHSS